jgi:hypothetical protein
MPTDRLCAVIAAMSLADIARLLSVAPPEFRGTLLDALSIEQLIEMLRTVPVDQSVELLLILSRQRLSAVVDSLPDGVVATLLERLPEDPQDALLEVMDPRRRYAVLARKYEHDVTHALARANFHITIPDGAPSGIVHVQALDWGIVVAIRYGDDGRIAVRDAETGAYRLRASAALSVTSRQPADDVVRYCRESRAQGRPIDAVAWADTRDDGSLTRTLVSLLR